ncbi:unnamed protein product [Eruca vesicaria subsp. sativa]|uniref:Uncharacterized protein n=1 Tax=Eruca vesicaria subsp. sativa TaxID=29727 RepID=A0ABC8J8E8_ERUVS|nr:unnamed protein product [Eruca vesicaria subsp. sativa]
MSPKMGSIFAQVYKKSVSMGRSRNFSSSPTNSSKESKNIALANFFVTRALGVAIGYLSGHYLIGDLDKICEERMQEDLRKARSTTELLTNVSKLSNKSAN